MFNFLHTLNEFSEKIGRMNCITELRSKIVKTVTFMTKFHLALATIASVGRVHIVRLYQSLVLIGCDLSVLLLVVSDGAL